MRADVPLIEFTVMRMHFARPTGQDGGHYPPEAGWLALAAYSKKVFAVSAVWLFIVAEIGLGQSKKPEFTGVWRLTGISRGPVSHSTIEIKQTDATFSMRHILENRTMTDWSIYPTDGTVIKTKGRNHVENTGHWDANALILESKGPGNAPWVRSTMRQVLRLSENGRTMTIKMHELSDKDSVHDYAVELERLQ